MEFQGERVPGVDMDLEIVESMVQDENPEQEMLNEQEQFPPQTDPEPKMGAAAAEAAVYDTSPSLLRNPPPIPAETAHPSAPDMAQLFAMLAEMNKKMDTNAQGMKSEMDENMQKLRGEMQNMGRCLQAGIMAAPRAGTNELGGSATAVRPAVEAGEKKIIRGMCWARSVEVTEKVTDTEGKSKWGD